MKEFFTANRKKIYDLLNSGEMAVFFSGRPPKKIGDENYPFTPNRNFYYLTGLSEPGIALVIYKGSTKDGEVLFLNMPDEEEEKWTGEVLKNTEAREKSGINDFAFMNAFRDITGDIIFRNRITKVYADMEKRSFYETTDALDFAAELKRSYPYIRIADIYNYLADIRSVKTESEIQNIRKAIEITQKGIYAMMKNCHEGMYEYEVEAYFDYELKRAGVFDKAFASIVASGINGCVLHYSDNNTKIGPDSLILCDVGATHNFYSADITRTFPAGGRFTPYQRDIYNIVLEGNLITQENIRAGIPFRSLNENLKKYYAKELKAIKLIKLDEEVANYYWHGVSHLLGLETHDVGRHNEGLLKEGMVLTVEPGLYIAEKAVGIRIEDDVVVKKNGCINLSSDIIKTADEIEGFMK